MFFGELFGSIIELFECSSNTSKTHIQSRPVNTLNSDRNLNTWEEILKLELEIIKLKGAKEEVK